MNRPVLINFKFFTVQPPAPPPPVKPVEPVQPTPLPELKPTPEIYKALGMGTYEELHRPYKGS